MDITQNGIKINQTKSLNGAKTKSASLAEDPVHSFDQILAMFNSLGQSNKRDGQKIYIPSLQNVPDPLKTSTEATKSESGSLENLEYSLMKQSGEVTDKESADLEEVQLTNPSNETTQEGLMYESEEDWDKIDSVLTVLAARIQQIQQSEEAQLVFDSSTGGPQLSEDSITLNSLPKDSPEDRKVMAQLVELVQGMDQLTSVDLKNLPPIISDLNSKIESASFQVPDIIKQKIQIISNELNSKKVTDGLKQQNELNQNAFYVSQPELSLDKNQVIFSSVTHAVSRVSEENRVVRTPRTPHMDDLTKVSGQPLMAIHQQQATSIQSEVGSLPPKLTVSEFAPEVSEWISRNLKLSNGQSGSTEAKFSLYPEHLGHIEIKVNSLHGQVSAEILTDTPLAKELLEGQLQHLRAALQQVGLQVQKLDILQQSPGTADPSQSGLTFSQDGSSHSSREQRTYTSAQDGSKGQNESTEQNERELESLSITYGGSTRKTTSRIDFTA
ncbi:flagellar hook-length control protein FliK [Bacillaceae bacterium C204]|uniref:flagellar hook-length control protein FliK n=1 Tax=Neobacillus sp. 204 TaxID=3383351 RepID=UPI00397908D6